MSERAGRRSPVAGRVHQILEGAPSGEEVGTASEALADAVRLRGLVTLDDS